MPKKRTIRKGFTQATGRAILAARRAAARIAPKQASEAPEQPTYHSPKDHTDIAKLMRAKAKRERKMARNRGVDSTVE
jgi:hypothetical protein